MPNGLYLVAKVDGMGHGKVDRVHLTIGRVYAVRYARRLSAVVTMTLVDVITVRVDRNTKL